MRVPRFGSFGTLLLIVLFMPVSSQAQFGSLIHAAKSLKTSIDSAKAVVDTTKTVVSAGKAAVTDATNGSLTVDAATDTSKAKHGAGSKAAGEKASASGPGASAGVRTSTGAAGASVANKAGSRATTTPASSASGTPASATSGTSATRARVASTSTSRTASAPAQPTITESSYAEFARGAAVQQALLKANPKDQSGALTAAVSASGLTQAEYTVLRSRVGLYYALAQSNSLAKATEVISAPELAVLNAHKADVLQLMQP